MSAGTNCANVDSAKLSDLPGRVALAATLRSTVAFFSPVDINVFQSAGMQGDIASLLSLASAQRRTTLNTKRGRALTLVECRSCAAPALIGQKGYAYDASLAIV